jgi:hypothetical protein
VLGVDQPGVVVDRRRYRRGLQLVLRDWRWGVVACCSPWVAG